jgi:GT2 family glycosyltransferase
MDLSIIIVSFNTKELLDRCLSSVYESLKGSMVISEVIVVDNGSTDGSKELVKKKFPNVRTMWNTENVGFGKANNQAINAAKGKYVLLLNSDTQALDDAIPSLYQFASEHPDSLVGGKLLNEDRTPQSSAGPAFSLPIIFLMLFAKGDQLHITRSSPSRITKVAWVSGACIIASQKLFRDVGLFDEGIFMYMEEVELLARAAKIGYTTVFYPKAQLIHSGAASSGSRKAPVLNIYRGLLYFYRKHRSIMEQWILVAMLRAKAYLAILIGKMTNNRSLVTIYEEALDLV